jgi:Protein O-mannosyl-transferase TMEM260-like
MDRRRTPRQEAIRMASSPAQGRPKLSHDTLWVGGLVGGFLLLYLRTLCPTVYLGDTGEISTAIATGGVIHPPGYPLFWLFGRLAMAVVPVGEPAFRIGCAVALAAAAAVGTLYLLCRELGAAPVAAATAAAVFGAGHTFWEHATQVEVYAPHALLVTLLLVTALRYARTGRLRWLGAATLAGSLGLAHHLTIVLLIPGLLVICGRRLWVDAGLGRRLALVAALLVVGPALYSVLLIRARAEPLHAWGHPDTPALLWNHASAHIYRGLLAAPNSVRLAAGMDRASELYTADFAWGIALLPFIGAVMLWKRDRRIAVGMLLAVAAVLLYNACYTIDDIAGYYLAAWVVAAALLALALDAGWGRVRAARGAGALAGAVALVMVGSLLGRNWGACDLSATVWVREFARHKLESTAARSVLVTSADIDTFPVWYAQDVLGIRPDVVTIDRAIVRGTWIAEYYGADPSRWYFYHLRRKGVPAPLDTPRDRQTVAQMVNDTYLIDLLRGGLHGRPIFTTFSEAGANVDQDPNVFLRWLRAHFDLSAQGIVMRWQPHAAPRTPAALLADSELAWNKIHLPDRREIRRHHEPDLDNIAEHYANLLVVYGDLARSAGRREQAEAIYRRALAYSPHYHAAALALAALK